MLSIYWLIIIVQRMGHFLEGMVTFCCTVHSDTITVGSPSLSSVIPFVAHSMEFYAQMFANVPFITGFAYELWGCGWWVPWWSLTKSGVCLFKKKNKLTNHERMMHPVAAYQWFMKHKASALSKFWQMNHNHNQNLPFFQTIIDRFFFFVLVLVLSFPIIYRWKYSQQIKRTPKWETNNSPTVHAHRYECSHFEKAMVFRVHWKLLVFAQCTAY